MESKEVCLKHLNSEDTEPVRFVADLTDKDEADFREIVAACEEPIFKLATDMAEPIVAKMAKQVGPRKTQCATNAPPTGASLFA